MITNNVYTFFEGFGSEAKLLVSLWKTSWQKYGWNPIVLSLKDIQPTNEYTAFKQTVQQYPTVNNPMFEWFCYARWFAMYQNHISGLHVDIDVLNFGCDVNEARNVIPKGIGCISMQSIGGLWCDVGGYTDFVNILLNVNTDTIINYASQTDVCNHMSDMHIFNYYCHTRHIRPTLYLPHINTTIMASPLDLKTFLTTPQIHLVHFCSNFCMSQEIFQSKARCIKYLVHLKEILS